MAILKFQNPNNNYVETYNTTLSPIWCLLFGPLYWLARRNIFHALISLALIFLTFGISQLGYALFANAINLKAYGRNGWIEKNDQADNSNSSAFTIEKEKSKGSGMSIVTVFLLFIIFIVFPFIIGSILKGEHMIDEARRKEQEANHNLSQVETQTQAIKTVNPNTAPQKLPTQITVNPADKIAEHAVMPITKSGYPTTHKKWGSAKIKHINALQEKAALKIASSPECNRLDMLALSNDRSTPPNKIVFFADCTNGQRFYISEAEIKASGAVKSKNDKLTSITDNDAQQACIGKTKAMLHFPSSFDLKRLSVEVSRGITGNIAVTFNFDAKNGLGNVLPQKARCILGNVLPQKARCIIDDQGIHPVEISGR